MKSITALYCECPRCYWDGSVGDAEAGEDGELVCPVCWARVVIEDEETTAMHIDYSRLPRAPLFHVERSGPPSFPGAPRWYYTRGANFGRLAAGPVIVLFRMPWLHYAARALHPECCSRPSASPSQETK